MPGTGRTSPRPLAKRPSTRARRRPGWSLRLLGLFELRTPAGKPRRVPSRKAQALLAYLALRPGPGHSRARLADLLWGETDSDKARNSLRQALFVARRALSPLSVRALRSDGERVSLAPGFLRVDVSDLEHCAGGRTPAQWRRAGDLYGGDLLEGLEVAGAEAFEEWLLVERGRLRQLAVDAMARELEQLTASGAVRRGLRVATRLLALDPLHEVAHRARMRLYALDGRRTSALEQYQTCVETLQRELGVEPEVETQRLYQELMPASGAPGDRRSGSAAVPAARGRSPLVGREAELALLERSLPRARAPAGTVLVTGEAGVGKTRLLEEVLARALERGARILVGRCHETERTLPFGVWLDAFREAGLLRDPRVWRALTPGSRAELGRLFPELAERAPGDPDDVGRLFEAVTRGLAIAAARQPIVVAVEDLHWADDMSLRLLSFVARRVPGPLLILTTAREEELSSDSTLSRALGEIESEGRLQRTRVAPLAREDALSLVQALAPSARDSDAIRQVGDRVWSLSEGNPFVILEAMRSVDLGAGLPPAPPVLPERVRELIERRLGRLSPPSRGLLGVAALVGREFDFPLLQRASDLDPGACARCIEELVRQRVVRAAGDRFAFVHNRVREAVDTGVLPHRRPMIHRAVAGALEALHADSLPRLYDRLARHYTLANDAERAVAYARRAASQNAKRYALREALAALEEADRLCLQLPREVRRRRQIELAVQQAQVLVYAGQAPEIPARLEPHEPALEQLDDPALAGPFYFSLGFANVLQGDRERGPGRLRRALAEAERAGDAVTAGSVQALMSFGCVWSGRFREGAELAWEAVRALRATGERHWLGKAWFYGSVQCAILGDQPRARRAQAEAEAIARETDDRRLLSFATWAHGYIDALGGRPRAAIAACRRAVALAPDPCGSADAHGFLGYAHLVAGHADEAVAALEEGARGSARGGFLVQQGWFLGWLAEAYLQRGDVERALERAREALALAETTGFPLALGGAHRALGAVAQARGALPEARRRLEAAAECFAAVGAAADLARTRQLLGALAGAAAVRDRARGQFAAS